MSVQFHLETQALLSISENLFLNRYWIRIIIIIISLRYSIPLHYYFFLNYKEVPKAHFSASPYRALLGSILVSFSYPPVLHSENVTTLLPTKLLGLDFPSLWASVGLKQLPSVG